jgi:hypothetical protein
MFRACFARAAARAWSRPQRQEVTVSIARLRALALALSIALLALAAAASEPPDWDAIKDVDTVSVGTTNADGTVRYTTVWLVVVGGRGYLRTGNTTWGENVARDPNVTLVIDEKEYALRVELVEAEDERALVTAAFNEKYGWSDSMIGWFRGGRPKIMRLASL